LKRIVAYIASFFFKRWTLKHYPVTYTRNGSADPRWLARIEGWPLMMGLGNSRSAAYDALQKSLASHEAAEALPRPGSEVPIKWAPAILSQSYQAFGREFVRRIFGYEDVMFTDMSSLSDLLGDKSLDEIYDKIRIIYGVDVSDIDEGNLVQVLARVSRREV
jgi:hypothetical protein